MCDPIIFFIYVFFYPFNRPPLPSSFSKLFSFQKRYYMHWENSDCKRLDIIHFHEIVKLKVKVSSSYTYLHFLLKPLQMSMCTVLLGWGED